MTREEHIERHKLLHTMLDELVADFFTYNREKLLTNTTVMELVSWSNQQTEDPVEGEPEPIGKWLKRQMEPPGVEAAIQVAKLVIAFEQAFGVYFPDPAKLMAELGSAILEVEGVRYWISPSLDAITCTKCRRTSRNPNDVAQRYCGFCKVFHDDPRNPATTI